MRIVSFLFIWSLVLPAWSIDLENSYLVNGCTLINWKGERERVFPGNFCQFFDDGSFVSGNVSSLRLIAKDSSIGWEYKGHIHHQVNLSNDLQRILFLSSDFVNEGTRDRFDRFVILSRDGKVLFSETSVDLLKQVDQPRYNTKELTHFNSFYEIPEITGKAPSYIKKGNYIANSNGIGVFILSSDLKKVLHFKRIRTSENHQIHDVQILPNGHMIYFNNEHILEKKSMNFSTVEEMDLNTGKIVFEFRAKPEATFYSHHCGGVQKIDNDKILFSHMLTGTYVYSTLEKTITKYVFQTHMQESGRFYPSQQVKAFDLRAFLSHWK